MAPFSWLRAGAFLYRGEMGWVALSHCCNARSDTKLFVLCYWDQFKIVAATVLPRLEFNNELHFVALPNRNPLKIMGFIVQWCH